MSTGDSERSEVDSLLKPGNQLRSVFVCGMIPRRWHNSSLQAVMQDLFADYYVCSNGQQWKHDSNSRILLANAEAFIFFVNEFTLGDINCLITLQNAWHLMLPIIMLRPPRTKLVICAREDKTDVLLQPNGSIRKTPSPLNINTHDHHSADDIDYPLLQDVLYEGYKASIVYDRLDHSKSMMRISRRLQNILPSPYPVQKFSQSGHLSRSRNSSQSRLSNGSQSTNATLNINRNSNRNSSRPPSGLTADTGTANSMRHSKSTGNLSSTGRIANKEQRAPTLRQQHEQQSSLRRAGPMKIGKTRDQETDRSDQVSQVTMSRGPPSIISSFSTSIDRRMSMSSLDDFSNYQSTQYLVFPVQDRSKKPILIKFPEDLVEEQFKDGSVWGSDTSLEEEAELASQIRGDFDGEIDPEESPIGSPAPYMESLA